MAYQDTEHKILEILGNKPNQRAKDLADQLDVDKKTVNSLLYGRLSGKVKQDKHYRWSLVNQNNTESNHEQQDSKQRYADTDLAKICRYYLACMGFDDAGVSVFAYDKYNNPDYYELETLPKSSDDLSSIEGFQKLLGKARRQRSRHAIYLGYPTCLKYINTKKWEGYKVEPLLLFAVDFENEANEPQLDLNYPIINQKAIQDYTNAAREELMNEVVQLEEELGLEDSEAQIDVDELVLRLKSIRTDWPWKEDIDPDDISTTHRSLSEPQEPGIYNRVVVCMAEKSPFTQGLESELQKLAQLSNDRIEGTALYTWLNPSSLPKDNDHTAQQRDSTRTDPLIEVLPMNLEQREAVKSALEKPLTVITGPPGTGKSQVVTNLLTNAAWQDKAVVFASKNNKAVDVVETRVNNLGTRPFLLRMGSSAYQTRLAEYLMGLLSASATQEDQLQYEEAQDKHQKLSNKLQQLDDQTDALINARNYTDKLEQEIEEIRAQISTELFDKLKNIDIAQYELKLDYLTHCLGRADQNIQNVFVQLLWPLLRERRLQVLYKATENFKPYAQTLEVTSPNTENIEKNIPNLWAFKNRAEQRISDAKKIVEYHKALRHLQSQKTLENISSERKELLDKVASNSEKLWQYWLRLQPARLKAEDRELLTRYNSVLKMVINSGPNETLPKKVYDQYKKLSEKASHLLPCWAVTALSARGKVPFEPANFDIVVFDEASQCDIASALPLLYRAKSAVIIGDPQQLSHISNIKSSQDQQLLQKFDLIEEYPHWGYSYNSLFDLAAGISDGSQIVRLLDHHRSHADIINFSNQQFYESQLRVATKYDYLKRLKKSEPGVRWIDCPGEVSRPSRGGAFNTAEAEQIKKELHSLVIDRGYQGSIGIVSPFRAQVNTIRQVLDNDQKLSEQLVKRDCLVETVHKFQGDERDIMVFSPVVSHNFPSRSLHFLRHNGNLFNVAITRACAQLIVVGDLHACSECGVSYLENFAKYAQSLIDEESKKQAALEYQDFGPEFPPIANTDEVSEWEKVLYKALYQAGIKTYPQYNVEKYALDLAYIDGDMMLDIEVDGEKYHRNWTGELCRRDQLRNQRMYELGWDVIRFWVYEIRDDLPGCVARIQDWIDKNAEQKSQAS